MLQLIIHGKGSGNAKHSNGSGNGGALVIIYANQISQLGSIYSNGTDATSADATGGSSGGGSINIFCKSIGSEISNITENLTVNGGINGGKGSINIGIISGRSIWKYWLLILFIVNEKRRY